MKYLSLGALLSVLVAGCAQVSQQQNVATPVGQSLTAGVGDVILRVEGRESMPNALGGADIFGRTRPTGFTTIQYGGMQNGKVVLLRSGVVTQSEATTLNSTGDVVQTRHGALYVPPAGSTQTSVSQPTIPILVDLKTASSVPALGKTIVIQAATPTSLQYQIQG
ncbi:hypothetical protein [Bradyrhizobium sp. McL0616]|uniref:hypothetical protein n=1 Tax=Bradyrhizobium sp. McL0616 TaxID=3415674 RepID=UPI003CEE21F3